MIRRCLAACCVTLALAALPIALAGQAAVAPSLEPKVDAVFAKWAAAGTCNPDDEVPCVDGSPPFCRP